MRFDIAGLEESYGRHRYSNNAILNELSRHADPDPDLSFVWWVEKMFLDPKYAAIVRRMCSGPWFGVMHVPLLTPNWAMYSQNNLARLYFLDSWRAALKNCRGIITLSRHMQQQLQALYPDLPVFSLKHPMEASSVSFDAEAFRRDPKLLLVGTWLRDFDRFCALRTNLRKKLILNHYTAHFLTHQYAKYRPMMLDSVKQIEHVDFLENEEYDRWVGSSLLYLGLHETSANNAVCECISYAVPFVSRPHPAVIEYCGADYPLLVEDDREIEVTTDQVMAAHDYLRRNTHLREALSMENFIAGMRGIYDSIAA